MYARRPKMEEHCEIPVSSFVVDLVNACATTLMLICFYSPTRRGVNVVMAAKLAVAAVSGDGVGR